MKSKIDQIRYSIYVLLLMLPCVSVVKAAAPRHATADLVIGTAEKLILPDKSEVTLELVSVEELRDTVRNGVRQAKVVLKINDSETRFTAEPYSLPHKVGRWWIDCPVTAGYATNSTEDHWKLEKNAQARIRVWSSERPWSPEPFVYPVRQRWFASGTQMANEPTFVDGGEDPARAKIYYHSGLDIGGPEGLAEVVAATDGMIVSLGNNIVKDLEKDHPVRPRYDVIYLRDSRGWHYRYSHLQQFAPGLKAGETVKRGQSLGVLGKEGGSGGWAHLHFEIKARQPSGEYGTEEGYAFLWEAEPARRTVVAVARPHRLVRVNEPVTLDGSKSYAADGPVTYQWTLTNGDTSTNPTVTRTYKKPGHYSEMLCVTDRQGRVSYDFAVVQVVNPDEAGKLPPSIQAAYWPSNGIKTSTPVTFLVRTFRTTDGEEKWNFGDGTPEVLVKSDGNATTLAPAGFAATVHRFAKPGDYIVTVLRTNNRGETATAQLHVHVEEPLK